MEYGNCHSKSRKCPSVDCLLEMICLLSIAHARNLIGYLSFRQLKLHEMNYTIVV